MLAIACFGLARCSSGDNEPPVTALNHSGEKLTTGTLFIIGGGPRPESLMLKLRETVRDTSASAAVLTMASAEPDSAWWYLHRDLKRAGFKHIWHFDTRNHISTQTIDSLRSGGLLFISGGDQSAFLNRADTLNIIPAIHEAYQNGAVIAGTSAGAAMMSTVMITGDQKKHPEYEPTYSRLQAHNAVYAEGLGLLDNAIIDQHFVERSRYNRMFTALYDFPDKMVIGIGESTALIVQGKNAWIAGNGQVIIAKRKKSFSTNNKDLLFFDELTLSSLGHGDSLSITQ